MGTKSKLKEIFEVESKFGAIFTGGSVEWTSDGKILICQCGPVINLLDVDSGQLTGSLGNTDDEENSVSDDTVISFALSADDQHVVSSHKSGLFRLWHIPELKVVKLWKSVHKGPVAKLALTFGGTLMASGGSDSSVRLWDLVHQSCTHNLLGVQGVISVLTFHPDKSRKLLLGAADDATIVGWNVETGKPTLTLKGHFSRVSALSIHSDNNHIISCGRDKVVILWDLNKQCAVSTIPLYEGLEGLALLPKGISLPGNRKVENNMCVAVAGERGVIRVWDLSASKEVYVQTNSLVSKAKEEGSLAVTQLLWNSDSYTLGVVSVDHNIILHKIDTFQCIKQFIGFSDEILDIAYLGAEDSHLAVATNSTNVALYRVSDMSCSLLQGHTDLVLALATSRVNPKLLVSCAKDYSVRVWYLTDDGNTAKCIGHGQRHTAAVGTVQFGQLSSEIFASAGQDNCLKLWNLPSKFSEDLQPTVLNATFTQIAHQKDINSVCFSPNDKLIATGSQDKTAKIWSTEDLSLIGVLRGHRRGVWCVRFSPADQMLLTTSADCTMRLWSLQDLSCIKSFEGHESSVVRGEFLTSGTQLVSGGADGLLKLWTVKSGECVSTLDQHNGRIWALAISLNENYIVTGGADSLMVKWKDVTAEKRQAALEEKEKLTIQEQQLLNLINNNELLKALKLALRLQRPHQCLTLIQGILKKGDIQGLSETVCQLGPGQQEDLLKYAVLWNSNGKHCYTAQALLSVLLEEISSGKLRLEGLRSILEGLLPYTDRHLRRLSELQQDLHLLAFTAN
ncbi:Transducin beta-like protein 3 [Frankliniella fusca]|uniref:Transducin beta-like protein 3 n=1 Tax=Frankliniella fusca TaxID=407009 RepID=A0AAE1LB29_9NEOP|nr:Transducin beta-like protein 3 [Frankliniella fusca]